jgi:carbon-monoxide dehydrogenase large subunit
MSQPAETKHSYGEGRWRGRIEDNALVRGMGRFTDDIDMETAHAAFVRSPHAYAKVASLDAGAAASQPGVLAVYIGTDLIASNFGPVTFPVPVPDRSGNPPPVPYRPVLAADRVVHVGQAVAMVVAESVAIAIDAAEKIAVAYEPMEPTLEANADHAGDPIWSEAPANVAYDWAAPFLNGKSKADVDTAFANAAHVASLTLNNQRISPSALEPRSAIGSFDTSSGRFTLWCGSQGVAAMRDQLAVTLGIEPPKLRVLTGDVGGGFGMKSSSYPEYVAVLFASRQIGKPVRWVATRGESFLTDNQARDSFWRAELAMNGSGRFTAMRVSARANAGAFPTLVGHFCSTIHVLECLPTVYDVPVIQFETQCKFTNTVPVGPYRGAGRPEGNYLVERLVDEAAAVSGIDPAEIRRRNLIKPEQIPYTTAFGMTYDSGDFPAIFERALAAANYASFAERRKQSRKVGKLRGIGIGFYMEVCGAFFEEGAKLEFTEAGVQVSIAAGPNGQGHTTVFSRLVAQRMGIDEAAVKITFGDSDRDVPGFGSVASRTGMMVSGAVANTIDAVLAKAKPIAALLLQCREDELSYEQGHFKVGQAQSGISIFDVASRAIELVRQGVVAEGLNTQGGVKSAPSFPNGCHIAEVEIDPETGTTNIVSYIAVDDCGTVLDRVIVEGQLHGGIAQGLGQALFEATVYDASGQLITGSFMDYAMPRATSMPPIEILHLDTICKTNPLGVKGVGESGTTAAPPAIVNAILNALPPHARRELQMPLTPEKVWKAANLDKSTTQQRS